MPQYAGTSLQVSACLHVFAPAMEMRLSIGEHVSNRSVIGVFRATSEDYALDVCTGDETEPPFVVRWS